MTDCSTWRQMSWPLVTAQPNSRHRHINNVQSTLSIATTDVLSAVDAWRKPLPSQGQLVSSMRVYHSLCFICRSSCCSSFMCRVVISVSGLTHVSVILMTLESVVRYEWCKNNNCMVSLSSTVNVPYCLGTFEISTCSFKKKVRPHLWIHQ